eukprot:scaffold4004_cov105-Cylindrotheca_fusiformis.AAC.8
MPNSSTYTTTGHQRARLLLPFVLFVGSLNAFAPLSSSRITSTTSSLMVKQQQQQQLHPVIPATKILLIPNNNNGDNKEQSMIGRSITRLYTSPVNRGGGGEDWNNRRYEQKNSFPSR